MAAGRQLKLLIPNHFCYSGRCDQPKVKMFELFLFQVLYSYNIHSDKRKVDIISFYTLGQKHFFNILYQKLSFLRFQTFCSEHQSEGQGGKKDWWLCLFQLSDLILCRMSAGVFREIKHCQGLDRLLVKQILIKNIDLLRI